MEAMEIKRGNHCFFIGDTEETAKAYINWIVGADNILIIDQTVVSDSLSGLGLASKLVEEVVSMARQENKKIRATCPFARVKLEKDEQYKDILEMTL